MDKLNNNNGLDNLINNTNKIGSIIKISDDEFIKLLNCYFKDLPKEFINKLKNITNE